MQRRRSLQCRRRVPACVAFAGTVRCPSGLFRGGKTCTYAGRRAPASCSVNFPTWTITPSRTMVGTALTPYLCAGAQQTSPLQRCSMISQLHLRSLMAARRVFAVLRQSGQSAENTSKVDMGRGGKEIEKSLVLLRGAAETSAILLCMSIQELEELTCRRGIDRVQTLSPVLFHGNKVALPEAPEMVRGRSLA